MHFLQNAYLYSIIAQFFMLKHQEVFIKILKSRVHKKLSFIDLVSSILQINYDAAYRRVNNKTSLTLNEAVTLAKHFNISLNTLYNVGEKNSILVGKTQEINSASDLEDYFKKSYINFEPMLKKDGVHISYCANDLPIFYYLNSSKLAEFKIYAWLNLLDTKFSATKMPFDKFKPKESLLKVAKKFGDTYNQFNITEIWNDNILNKTVKQIYHYFEVGMLNLNDALEIATNLEQIIKKIELNARAGKRLDNLKPTSFTLYHNEIMSLGNNVLIKTKDSKLAMSPYSLLSYYIISNAETCDAIEAYFKKQLESSNLLSSTEEKGRSLFFNKLYQIINRLKTRLKIDDQLPLI